MTKDEIDEIERKLGFAVPEYYRTTMLNYPFPAHSFADDVLLPNRASDVIELNLSWLQAPSDVTRPFVIGTDGGEETYFVDAKGSDPCVFAFDLETARSRIQFPTWAAYLQDVRNTHAEIAADERAERERKLTKRWWEFWK